MSNYEQGIEATPDPEKVKEAVEWARQFRPGPEGNYSLLLLEAAEAWLRLLGGTAPEKEYLNETV